MSVIFKTGDTAYCKKRNRPVEIFSDLIDGKYYDVLFLNCTKNRTLIKADKLMKFPIGAELRETSLIIPMTEEDKRALKKEVKCVKLENGYTLITQGKLIGNEVLKIPKDFRPKEGNR